jgi:hypothetical protein
MLLGSQQFTTDLYSEVIQFSPDFHTLIFLQDQFQYSTPIYQKVLKLVRFSYKKYFYGFRIPPTRWTSLPPWFDDLNIIRWSIQIMKVIAVQFSLQHLGPDIPISLPLLKRH